jgi:hypothetical protein
VWKRRQLKPAGANDRHAYRPFPNLLAAMRDNWKIASRMAQQYLQGAFLQRRGSDLSSVVPAA